MNFYSDIIIGTCGVSVLYDFERFDYLGNPVSRELSKDEAGGAGWILTGFIDTTDCHMMYNTLCKKFKLVYQSPVRENRNSGNDFFFCIWDAR